MARKKETKEVSIFDELTSCIEDSYRILSKTENDYGFLSCCYGRYEHTKDCSIERALKIVEELKEKYEGVKK